MGEREITDVEGVLHVETDKAILFSLTTNKNDGVWLPKSQIEIERDAVQSRQITVTLPIWIAKEKGLI